MTIFNRIVTFFFLSITSFLLFTACSNQTQEAEADTNETNNLQSDNELNQEVEEGEKVKLQIAYQWSEESFYNRYKPIEEYLGNVEIEYIPSDGTQETIEEMFAAGVKPDMFVDENIFALQDLDVIYPLDEPLEQIGFDISTLDQPLLNSLRAYDKEGRIIGLPDGTVNIALYINKEVFDTFGIEYPDSTVPMTWPEVMDLTRKMTAEKDGIQYVGLDGVTDSRIIRQFAPVATDPESGEVLINQQDGYKEYLELVEEYYNIPGIREDESLGAAFSERRAAMTVSVNLAFGWLFGEDEDIEAIDLVPLPVWPEMPNIGPLPGTTPMVVANYSENKEMALKVLEAYYNPEILIDQVRSGATIPPVSDMELHRQYAVDHEQYQGKNLEAYHILEAATQDGMSSRWDEYVDLNSAIEAIIDGDDAVTALRELEEESARKISEAMAAQ